MVRLLVRVVTGTAVCLQAMLGSRLPITLSAMPHTSTWPPGIYGIDGNIICKFPHYVYVCTYVSIISTVEFTGFSCLVAFLNSVCMHVIKVVSLCRSRIKLAYQTHYVGDVRYIT